MHLIKVFMHALSLLSDVKITLLWYMWLMNDRVFTQIIDK